MLGDQRQDLLDQGGQMQTPLERRLVPALQHQLEHGDRLDRRGAQGIQRVDGPVHRKFGDIDPHDRRLARAAPGPSQALAHAGHGMARPELGDRLDVANVDAQLECGGRHDGAWTVLVLEAALGVFPVFAGQGTVVCEELLRDARLLTQGTEVGGDALHPLARPGEDQAPATSKGLEEMPDNAVVRRVLGLPWLAFRRLTGLRRRLQIAAHLEAELLATHGGFQHLDIVRGQRTQEGSRHPHVPERSRQRDPGPRDVRRRTRCGSSGIGAAARARCP